MPNQNDNKMYNAKPFTIKVTRAQAEEYRKALREYSKIWIQPRPYRRALTQNNFKDAKIEKATEENLDRVWIAFFDGDFENPVYVLKSVSKSGALVIQLDEDWADYRDSVFEGIAERDERESREARRYIE